MAIISNVKQSESSGKIALHYQEYVAAVRQQVGGTVGSPPVVTGSPPVVVASPNDGIETLDLPHVRPGDLITAEFINNLIDDVVDIDTRLQRIENLLARLLDRAKTTTSLQAVDGKP